ncbi:MAG: ribosome maturation factor RimM [Lentimicrobiaceae bacterium]|jgi:16S rRNA processing protein RimM|nr:ribosome maturation factor RimM [Lentimicrobiaceae bacterium]
MTHDDCFYFGKIIKTHGLKGGLSLRVDTDDPTVYQNINYILVEMNTRLIPFFITSFKLNANKAYITLQDINSIEQAQELIGKDSYLPLEFLPKLNGNKFYFHEVTGLLLVDETFGEIGTIEKVLEYPNQAVFQVFKNGKEVLIPIQDEVIKKVDRNKKTITVKAPEGLIELYLS